MVVQVHELDRDHVHGRYYVVTSAPSKTASPGFRKCGRVYVSRVVTGNDPLIQDVAAFEAMLGRDTPRYHAQLGAFRLAAKLGVLEKYFELAEKQSYSRKIRKLVEIEAGEPIRP